jgi:diaminopimelate decarboxylase
MTVEFPQHVPTPYYKVDGDCLVVGGRRLTELAAEIGHTPFYVYDRAVMDRRVQELRAALPADLKLHYAIKANPMPAVVAHMARQVDGLDVASGRELEVALATDVPRHEISFAGPGKSDAELEAAARAGIVVNLESEGEMRRLARIATRLRLRPKVAIRVNPDFELKTSGMKMSGGPKQFGIDAELVPAVLAELNALPLEFYGFHIYSGSQNLRVEALIEAQDQTVELALRLAGHAPGPVRMLNLGGGFGIPYFPGEQRLDLAPLGENLTRAVERIRGALPEAQPVIELGRYLVGEAGLYVCEVVDRKISRGQVFLVCNGGLHHHLAASGNFGQVIRKNYPALIGNKVRGTEREVASAVGPLCTPLDLLADRMEMAKAEPGDLVVVFQSGAYGFTASPLGFLSHPAAVEIVV